MITTIHSTRVYYNDQKDTDVNMIYHVILLYHSMKNHVYNMLYNNDHDITNEYFPLNAILEAKGVFKSNVSWNKKTVKNRMKRSKKIEKKLQDENRKLE